MNLEFITEQPPSLAHPTPLLFVHGMWHGAWCWAEHFLPYFARQGYAAHALSLRGHGHSEGREQLRWTSLAEYVADVAQVASSLASPPVVIGHSMGGMVLQKYLETHRPPAAVLLASAPPQGLIPATLRFARRHPFVVLKVSLSMSMYPIIGTPALCREVLFSPGLEPDQLEIYFRRMQEESFRAYLDMMRLNLPRPNRVQTPLLVLGAAADGVISVAEVEATARAYRTEAEIFAGMGHDMMLEPDWPKVAGRILDWLAEQKI